MNFLVLVKQNPYQYQASNSAIKFCEAVIRNKHTLLGVFFYQNGVLNGNRLAAFPADEFHPIEAWQKLHLEYDIPLTICVTSSIKRGVMDKHQQLRYSKNTNNISDAFSISGLAEFVTKSQQAERLITFG